MDITQGTRPAKTAWRFQYTTRIMLIVTAVVTVVLGVGMYYIKRASMKATCVANLKHIEVGLLGFERSNGSFPSAYSVDATGRRVHSWRARIASEIDPNWKGGTYKWDEPWDGPNNSKLQNEPREIFSCPADPAHNRTATSYLAVVGPRTAWPGEKSRRFEDFTSSVSYCLTVVETANSGIHWMEPRDLEFDKTDFSINGPKRPGISSAHAGGANVGFADSNVQFLSDKTDPEIVKQLLSTDNKFSKEVDATVPD